MQFIRVVYVFRKQLLSPVVAMMILLGCEGEKKNIRTHVQIHDKAKASYCVDFNNHVEVK
jgi:hypothetical protein